MSVDVPCPQCARVLRVTEAHRGRSALCPGCQTSFVIPTEDNPSDEVPVFARAPEPRVREEDDEDFVARRFHQQTIKLNFWVEKDSGGLLWRWGTSAQLTEDGLFVGKGEKGFYAEPRHCTAEHLGGNRISIEANGRTVVLKLNKAFTYNAKLARALVDYLNGGLTPLDPADYRIDWYMIALSCLPFGIALIAMPVSDSSLMAGLWGGLGGGLFGVCISLAAAEKVPKAIRVMLILAVAAGGHIALFVLHPNL